jgi:hypothetical protein
MILSLCVWVWAGGVFHAPADVVTLPDKKTTSSAVLVLKALTGLSSIVISVGVSGAVLVWSARWLHGYLAARAGNVVAWLAVAALVLPGVRLIFKTNAADS